MRKHTHLVIAFRLVFWLALLSAYAPAIAAGLTVHVANAQGAALADAVVFVPAAGGVPAAGKRATVAQHNRLFEPFVTVITRGTAVDFPNEDTMLHHVYSFSPAKQFEIRLYKGTPRAPVVFDVPGVVVLGCNLHDWMLAYIVIVDTRFHAKTGADGIARLGGLPAGAHELMAWYPGMREPVLVQRFESRAEESKRVDAMLDVAVRTRPRAPPGDPMKY